MYFDVSDVSFSDRFSLQKNHFIVLEPKIGDVDWSGLVVDRILEVFTVSAGMRDLYPIIFLQIVFPHHREAGTKAEVQVPMKYTVYELS